MTTRERNNQCVKNAYTIVFYVNVLSKSDKYFMFFHLF